ncbi:hypothetical protein LCGC14_2342700, partial [marine sediment metagenome]
MADPTPEEIAVAEAELEKAKLEKTEPAKETALEKKIRKDEMIVSKQGYNEMQKSLIALQKKDEANDAEKLELEKTNLLTQLSTINPKFAELHKDSNKDMLLGALATAKAEASSFTELNKGKDKGDAKIDHTNFTNVKYDWTKHKNT